MNDLFNYLFGNLAHCYFNHLIIYTYRIRLILNFIDKFCNKESKKKTLKKNLIKRCKLALGE